MREDWHFGKLALVGALAGIVAGLVMLVFMAIVTAADGQGVWAVPKWISSAIYGDSWLGFNAADVFTGLAIHFVISLVLGGLFAMIAVPFATEPRQLLFFGLVWGVIAYVVLSMLGMGALDETMAQQVPLLPWFLAHLFFGLVVGYLVMALRATAAATA